jgi:hypothetical protein
LSSSARTPCGGRTAGACALAITLVLVGSAHAQSGSVVDQPPLQESPAWIVTGSVRQQYERFTNEEWGAGPRDDSGCVLQRYMLAVERHWGSRVRALVEMKSGIELGRVGGPRVPDEDAIDVHQGYVDLRLGSLDLRIGRQELQFGSSRLVSVRDLNVRQSFDAARATMTRGAWRFDLFTSRPASTRPGSFDDATDRARRLWGAYVVRRRGQSRNALDVYYLGYGRDAAHYDGAQGREVRHSFGARLWGTPAAMDYNVEAVGQWGSVGHTRIQAWGAASDVGYRFARPMRPRVGLRADVSSGDRNPNDATLGTFNGLFASAAYFGLIATAGPANHVDVQPQFGIEVSPSVSLTGGWLLFWRREGQDGIYTWSGQRLRSAAGTHSKFVGQSPGVTLRWTVNPRLSVSGDLSAFTAGPFVRESGAGETSMFVRATVAYRFSIGLGSHHGQVAAREEKR